MIGEPVERQARGATVYVSYRWYFPGRALAWSTTNGIRYHDWIRQLKSGKQTAIILFTRILDRLFKVKLEAPQAIIAVPPSQCFHERPTYPVAEIAKEIAQKHAIYDLSYSLRRVTTIPKVVDYPLMRSIETQMAYMDLIDIIPSKVKHVLIVDDITTSGATIDAAIKIVRLKRPDIRITAFAFGKTNQTGSTPFPEIPEFPDPLIKYTVEEIKTIVKKWK
jgi:predicted amidophosphoribosyltransferase